MDTLIILLAGASVGLFLWGIFGVSQKASGALGEEARRREGAKVSPLLIAMLVPARPLAHSLTELARRLEASAKGANHPYLRLREHCARSLTAAGSPGGLHPDEMTALSLAFGVTGMIVGVLLAVSGNYSVIGLAALGAAMGLGYPFIWLDGLVTRRQNQIRKDLPYMLDLLTLCIEAGLDFTTALARIMGRLGNSALADELRQLLREVQIGRPRADGLRDLGRRVGVMEVSAVVQAIVQAEQLGTSIGPTLRIQADDARRRRTLRAEELAMKAPVKMLFPLVAFIFPTTLIIILGPVFIKYLPALGGLAR